MLHSSKEFLKVFSIHLTLNVYYTFAGISMNIFANFLFQNFPLKDAFFSDLSNPSCDTKFLRILFFLIYIPEASCSLSILKGQDTRFCSLDWLICSSALRPFFLFFQTCHRFCSHLIKKSWKINTLL